jgi:glycosyltransferase involved in cell wall biosynthesis
LRVAVDARHLAGGRGVAHYTAGLLGALAAGFPGDRWRAFAPGRGPLHAPAGVEVVRHPAPSRALFGAAALGARPRLDVLVGGADVAWLPAPAPVAVSRGVPVVLTVHDLSWVERPGDFTRYERVWHRLARVERLARRSAAVVCDSFATRAAVLDAWSVDPARLHVVHPGVPARDGTAAPDGPPYLLVVGALEPRKGVDVLARAIPLARARGLAAEVVVAGDGRERRRLEGLPGVRVLGAVPDARLGALYAGALALVMPSRGEGFGFPPLEAALAGTPSVLSDLPVFGETLGDAALRVPAGDADALAGALVRIGADAALRERLAAAARPAAERFTWAAAAERLHAILAGAAAP